VIPLSLPVIATIALFYFVDMWNAYFTIVLYISDSRKHTLQVILRSIIIKNEEIDREDPNMMLLQNIKYTTVIVALIPVLALYPFLQRYFTKGILLGSLKG
jgi:putative aldouronate transport system permease protein